MFVQVLGWILIMYGFMSLIQDIVTEFTYKRYNKNIKVFICIRDFENEIENFEREISKVKWQFKNISINVVNMDDNVTDSEIQNFFEGDKINIMSREDFYHMSSSRL